MFGDKGTGSSEKDPGEEGWEEYTDKKKRKRRKQKKIGEDLWSFAAREEVESLPVGIDELKVYIVDRKEKRS